MSRIRVIRAYTPVQLMSALKAVERICESSPAALTSPSLLSSSLLPTLLPHKLGPEALEAVQGYVHSKQRPAFHTRDEVTIVEASKPPIFSHASLASLPLPPPHRGAAPSPPPSIPPAPGGVALLLIDNVAAFHWQTRPSPHPQSALGPSFTHSFSQTLQRLLGRWGVRGVVTKPVLFKSAGEVLEGGEWVHTEYMGEGWGQGVRYRLLLRRGEDGCEGRVVGCREEERAGQRWVKNAIHDQRPYAVGPEGIVFL